MSMTSTPPGGFAKKTGSSRPEWRPIINTAQVQDVEDTSNHPRSGGAGGHQRPSGKRRRSTTVNYEQPQAELGPDTQELTNEFAKDAEKANERRDRADATFPNPELEDTPRKRQRVQRQIPSPASEPGPLEPALPPTATNTKVRHSNRAFDKCKPKTQEKREGWIRSITKDWNMSQKSWRNLAGAPTSEGQVKPPQDWNNPLLIRLVDLAKLTRRNYQRAAAAVRNEMARQSEGAQLSQDIVTKVMDTLTTVPRVAPVALMASAPAPQNPAINRREQSPHRQETPPVTPLSPADSRSQTMSPEPAQIPEPDPASTLAPPQSPPPAQATMKTEAIAGVDIDSDSGDEVEKRASRIQAGRVQIKRWELMIEEKKWDLMRQERRQAQAA